MILCRLFSEFLRQISSIFLLFNSLVVLVVPVAILTSPNSVSVCWTISAMVSIRLIARFHCLLTLFQCTRKVGSIHSLIFYLNTTATILRQWIEYSKYSWRWDENNCWNSPKISSTSIHSHCQWWIWSWERLVEVRRLERRSWISHSCGQKYL